MIRNTLPGPDAVVGPALGDGAALGRTAVAGALGLGESCAACPREHAATSRQVAITTATIRAVLALKGGRWDAAVTPERGGRIASLRLDGAELLDLGIGVNQPTATNFVEGGAWGWDELVPTVDQCAWDGVALPDHGEAWRLPWRVESASDSSCAMSCEGRLLPWRLERRIILGSEVRAEYRLSNLGPADLPGYWCSHALFRYEADMEVDVGARLTQFAEGRSGKLFIPAGTVGRARLRWRPGPAIELSWDPKVAPHCAVWICNGDLGGYHQVAIEPATGGGDRPDSDQPPPILASGESLSWWLEIRAL